MSFALLCCRQFNKRVIKYHAIFIPSLNEIVCAIHVSSQLEWNCFQNDILNDFYNTSFWQNGNFLLPFFCVYESQNKFSFFFASFRVKYFFKAFFSSDVPWGFLAREWILFGFTDTSRTGLSLVVERHVQIRLGKFSVSLYKINQIKSFFSLFSEKTNRLMDFSGSKS